MKSVPTSAPGSVEPIRGWQFESDGSCRFCGKRMAWWKTPKGAVMPVDWDWVMDLINPTRGELYPLDLGALLCSRSHWDTCTAARANRRERRQKADQKQRVEARRRWTPRAGRDAPAYMR